MNRALEATRRRAVSVLLLGGLVAGGFTGDARAVSTLAVPAAGGCTHDAVLEAAVARVLRKKVRDVEQTSKARIEITFGCPVVSDPRQVTALRAHGHGGFLSVVDLDVDQRSGSASELRALRLQPRPATSLGDSPPKITQVIRRATTRAGVEALRRALAFANAALASTIHVELPAPAPGAVQSIAAVATTHDEALEIRLVGSGGQDSSRRWDGYVDSTHADARVPLEAAWEALWDLANGRLRPGRADDAERATFERLIDTDAARPCFLDDGLLQLAAVLATRSLIPALAAFLQTPSERIQTLAVNALATATGTDLRRDATGAVRPLADVVAAYRAIAGPLSAQHPAPRRPEPGTSSRRTWPPNRCR